MTPFELAQLRVKCVEIFVQTSSRLDFSVDAAFEKGAKLFNIVMQDIRSNQVDKPQLAQPVKK